MNRLVSLLTLLLALVFTQAAAQAQLSATLSDKLTGDANGNSQLEPGEFIEYTVTVTNNGPNTLKNVTYSDPLDSNTLLASGDDFARDDYYLLTGGGTIAVDAPRGILQNNDIGGALLTVVNTSTTTKRGRPVTVNADGSFSYNAGSFVGHDSFEYTALDQLGQSNAGVATLFVANDVWFVDNTKNGSGTLASPFETLEQAETSSAAGDAIFIFTGNSALTGMDKGIVIKENQSIIGQSSPIPFISSQSGFIATLPGNTPDFRPLLNKPVADPLGTTLIAGENVALFGLRVGDTGSQKTDRKGLYATDFGTIFMRQISFAHANSYLIDLRRGTVDAVIDSLENLSPLIPNAAMVNLDEIAGNFEVTGKAFGSTQGIFVGGGTADITFNDVNIINANGPEIRYTNHTGSLTINSNGGGISFAGANDKDAISIFNAANFHLSGTATDPFVIAGSGFGQGSGGSGNFGIAVTGGTNITFENISLNTGSGLSDTGIAIVDSPSVSILNSTVQLNKGNDCIRIGSSISPVDSNITISGNTITAGSGIIDDNSENGISAVFGSPTGKKLYLTITNNTINVPKLAGIEVGFLGADAAQNTVNVSGNKILDPGRYGLNLQTLNSNRGRFAVTSNEIDGERNILFSSRNSGVKPWNAVSLASVNDSEVDLIVQDNTIRDFNKDQIRISTFTNGFIRTLIDSNDMRTADNLDVSDSAILILTGAGSSDTVHAQITNNLVDLPDAFRSIEAYSQGTGSLICVDIDSNTGAGAALPPTGDIYLKETDGTFQAVGKTTIATRNNNASVTYSPSIGAIDNVANCQQVP